MENNNNNNNRSNSHSNNSSRLIIRISCYAIMDYYLWYCTEYYYYYCSCSCVQKYIHCCGRHRWIDDNMYTNCRYSLLLPAVDTVAAGAAAFGPTPIDSGITAVTTEEPGGPDVSDGVADYRIIGAYVGFVRTLLLKKKRAIAVESTLWRPLK